MASAESKRPDVDTREFPVAQITIPEGRRSVYGIEALADSMERHGLLQPIGLRSDGKLIYGHRRYLGALRKGWKTISARIYPETVSDTAARVMEIIENLQRQDLTALQKAEQTAELQRIYEKEYPETKHGATGSAKVNAQRWGIEDGGTPSSIEAPVPPFREVATSILGVKDPGTVNRYIRAAERLKPETKAFAEGTKLEDQIEALHEISFRETAEEQIAAAQTLLDGKDTITGLAERRRDQQGARRAQSRHAADGVTSQEQPSCKLPRR
jgi:ParB family chromosome partitioning protein